jgi:hypothetical protein
MMFFRPKPGISTKALKNHLVGGHFRKFDLNPYPLLKTHDHTHSPFLPFSFFLLFPLFSHAARPCLPLPILHAQPDFPSPFLSSFLPLTRTLSSSPLSHSLLFSSLFLPLSLSPTRQHLSSLSLSLLFFLRSLKHQQPERKRERAKPESVESSSWPVVERFWGCGGWATVGAWRQRLSTEFWPCFGEFLFPLFLIL